MVMIAGREYPTPLVVGGVAGVVILVAGQRLLGGGSPADASATDAQLTAGATPVDDLTSTDLGQFPASGGADAYDWWDAGGETFPTFPPVNAPPSSSGPTPVAPPTTTRPTTTPTSKPAPSLPPRTSPTTTAPAPAPSASYPAGTAAKAMFPAGTYKRGVVSGSTLLRYGADLTTGGFSGWAAAPKILSIAWAPGHTGTWFRMLSGAYAGQWFYKNDARIRWQPV